MNLRLYSIALLISALPNLALAQSVIQLNKEDFVAAERVSKDGQTTLKVKLSKSGRAKFRRLNKSGVGQSVHAEIAGVVTDFKLKEPIQGAKLEMGPYSQEDAQAVIREVNKK